jgi:hypothetical protein
MAKAKTDDDNGFFGIGDFDPELDFDLTDFDFLGDDDNDITSEMLPLLTEDEKQDIVIIKPKVEKKQITHKVAFENALTFVRQISLEPNERTFAWVNGSFIFGDMIEALWSERNVNIKELYICSLSISQENIDSLKTLLEHSNIQRMVIILSGYFYSMERNDLVPYLYNELGKDDRVSVCFGAYHCKMFCIETHKGNTITVHGSANMRSSNSIEQVMIEQDRDLYEYNRRIMTAIAAKFDTIKHLKRKRHRYALSVPESFDVVRENSGGNGGRK